MSSFLAAKPGNFLLPQCLLAVICYINIVTPATIQCHGSIKSFKVFDTLLGLAYDIALTSPVHPQLYTSPNFLVNLTTFDVPPATYSGSSKGSYLNRTEYARVYPGLSLCLVPASYSAFCLARCNLYSKLDVNTGYRGLLCSAIP